MKIRRDKLDTLFSEFIRKRAIAKVGGCECCLTPKRDILKDNGKVFPAWKQLQASHFWGRGKKATRFDPDNAVGICFHCHIQLTAHPREHSRWFEEHLGQPAFDLLEARACIHDKVDEKALEIYLKSKIEGLGSIPEPPPSIANKTVTEGIGASGSDNLPKQKKKGVK